MLHDLVLELAQILSSMDHGGWSVEAKSALLWLSALLGGAVELHATA